MDYRKQKSFRRNALILAFVRLFIASLAILSRLLQVLEGYGMERVNRCLSLAGSAGREQQ